MSLGLLKSKGTTEAREAGALESTMRRTDLLTGVTGIKESQREGTRSYAGLQKIQEDYKENRGLQGLETSVLLERGMGCRS